MKLICKQGEKALIIGAFRNPQYIGKVVTCIRPFFSQWAQCNAWEVDIPIGGCQGIADHHLMPIRDSDGEDETLTWAGKPEKKEKETTS